MRIPKLISAIVLSLGALAMTACGGDKNSERVAEDDVLVSIGDSTLRMSDVVRQIPVGLDPVDSVRMFHAIVDTWVRDLVLLDQAEKNITDMDKIERMVEQYRNSLILSQYLTAMSDGVSSDVSEERIRKYYDDNKSEMTLSQPIIKGAFLKVADTDPELDNLRKWMSSFTDESVDKIEKSGLRQASRYDYFRDQWHEWGAVAEQIPYRFYDADAFLKSTRNFETSEAGSTYLLHVSEYLPTGAEMPYEFARTKIAEILRVDDIHHQTDALISDIYRRSLKEGVLKPGKYDPIGKKMKEAEDGK